MNSFTNIILSAVILMIGFSGCKSSENLTEETQQEFKADPESPLFAMFDTSEVFSNNFTGFSLYDPEADSTIFALNEDKYFTPASNTKLFTFYTGLTSLPDSLPAIEYVVKGDSLIFWGTGDPTFLHPDFDSDVVFDFLKNRPENLFYSDENFDDELLGPGWAWGDYQYYYSTERSPFPIYGNVLRLEMEEIRIRRIKEGADGLAVSPKLFQSRIEEVNDTEDAPILHRSFFDNDFQYKAEYDTNTYTTNRPFHYTPELFIEMLSDTLGKNVEYISMEKPNVTGRLYSTPVDTVYKKMLQPSDNFIAEQLLFATASELGKQINAREAINHMKSEHLDDLPDEPEWMDGSGLSRYNLFTPRSIVRLLQKIDDEYEQDHILFDLLPAGGKSGTIRSWYGSRDDGPPYIYAKTGTLRNNHCLSGYLITGTGKKLIFSFMNNNYTMSTNELRTEMEKVLWHIHENY